MQGYEKERKELRRNFSNTKISVIRNTQRNTRKQLQLKMR